MSQASFGFEIEQRTLESIQYRVTTTNWGSSPASVAAVLYDVTDAWKNVSSTNLVKDETPAVNGDTITLPRVKSLTAEHIYFYDVTFVSGANTFAFFLRIYGVR
jgi:hypothetical protein